MTDLHCHTRALIFLHATMALLGLLTILGKSWHYATLQPQGEVIYNGKLGHAASYRVCLNHVDEVSLSSCHQYGQNRVQRLF